MIFLAEIGKKRYYYAASSEEAAAEVFRAMHPTKEIRLTETSLPASMQFRIGSTGPIYSVSKVKGTILSFASDSGMTGKLDIEMVMVEIV